MDSGKFLKFWQNFDRILMSKIRFILSLANRIFFIFQPWPEPAAQQAAQPAAQPKLKDPIPNLTPIFQPNHQTLEGSFSSASKPIFAFKCAFFSVTFSRATRFAILCTAPISKFEQMFVKLFRIFAQNSAKVRYFSTFFIEFCTDFDQKFAEFRRIF